MEGDLGVTSMTIPEAEEEGEEEYDDTYAVGMQTPLSYVVLELT
jgi:hypothetical protein